VLFELRSGRFDQRAIVDSRWADSLTCPAVEALIHLLVEEGVEKIEPVLPH
jgi:hypothetical protein